MQLGPQNGAATPTCSGPMAGGILDLLASSRAGGLSTSRLYSAARAGSSAIPTFGNPDPVEDVRPAE